jgi:hypothetical protein
LSFLVGKLIECFLLICFHKIVERDKIDTLTQLICYSRACAQNSDFLDRALLLSKSYSSKAMLILGGSHRFNNSTVVITIWLTVTKYPHLKWQCWYPHLKWQWIFYFLRRCCLSSITAKALTILDCAHEWHDGCFIRSRSCLPFTSTPVHPRYFGGVRVAHLLSFLCCLIMCLYVLSLVLWCPLRFPHETMFGSSLPLVVDRRDHIYAIGVCLCIVMSKTYCVVFQICFSLSCVPYVDNFSGMSIRDCPFGIL